MTLLLYSVFMNFRTNSDKVYWLHHVRLSICLYISVRLLLVEFTSNLIFGVLYGNLLINMNFGWNGSNMSPVAIRQLRHVTVAMIRCVVLRVFQCLVHLHCHGSAGHLIPACIIMSWKNTHTHTRYANSCMTDGFSWRLLLRTERTYVVASLGLP
jgi:hypothetical protein